MKQHRIAPLAMTVIINFYTMTSCYVCVCPFFVLSHDLRKIWDLMFMSHVQLVLSCFDLSCIVIWITKVNSNYIFVTILCLDWGLSPSCLQRIHHSDYVIPDRKHPHLKNKRSFGEKSIFCESGRKYLAIDSLHQLYNNITLSFVTFNTFNQLNLFF